MYEIEEVFIVDKNNKKLKGFYMVVIIMNESMF